MLRGAKRPLDTGTRGGAGSELPLLRMPAFLIQRCRHEDSTPQSQSCCPMKSMKESTNKAMTNGAETVRLYKDQQLCCHCRTGGGEEWRLQCFGRLPYQDRHKATHVSGCEGDVWQGDQGHGKRLLRKEKERRRAAGMPSESHPESACNRDPRIA